MTTDDNFLDWLAGFTDGEGCFVIDSSTDSRQWKPRLRIDLRDDDLDILLEIQERLAMGTITRHSHATGNGGHPFARWEVSSYSSCLKLVHTFDVHPLRAKKSRDYQVWREAVLESQKPPNQRDLVKMGFLHDKLSIVKRYEKQETTDYESKSVQLCFPGSGEMLDED